MALKFLSLTLTVFQNIILQHQACDCEIVPCELMETAILWTQSQYNHMSGEFAKLQIFFFFSSKHQHLPRLTFTFHNIQSFLVCLRILVCLSYQ